MATHNNDETVEATPGFIDRMRQELKEHSAWEKAHPVQAFFYNAWYEWPHRVRDARYEVKYAWQRVFRGYDDRMLWGYPDENARIAIEVLTFLRDEGSGHPMGESEESYKAALDKMIDGFKAYTIMQDLSPVDDEGNVDKDRYEYEYHVLKNRYEEGMELYVKHYPSLWD